MTKIIYKHWLRHLIILAAVIFFINLGFWQLRRLDQRQAINQEINAGLNRSPVVLIGQTVDPDELHRQRVTVTGTFENDETIVWRNQSYQGQPGFDLITPLRIKDSEQAVLVNRGWIPFEEFEPNARQKYGVEGEVTLEGVAYRSQTQPTLFFAPKDPIPEPGNRVDSWFRLDVERIQQQVDQPLLPVYIQELPDSVIDDSPPIREEITDLGPGSHFSYALQWFSFAVILVVTYAGFTWQEVKETERSSYR